MEEPEAIARVATEVLKLCHFDLDTGEDVAEKDKCSRACYRCLLSYANQPDHRLLSRFLIRSFLLELKKATTGQIAAGRSYDEQFQWLMERRDPSSNLEAEFLRVLSERRRRLPDRA